MNQSLTSPRGNRWKRAECRVLKPSSFSFLNLTKGGFLSLVKDEERSLSTALVFSLSKFAKAMILSRDKELNFCLSWRAGGLFSTGQIE